MWRKRSSVGGKRAWDIVRLALLWARKGGVFRNKPVINFTVLQKGIRKLRHSNQPARGGGDGGRGGALVVGDRQLSFDETPVIHVKMSRPSSLRFKMPHIPCIKPHVDFDYDFDFDGSDHFDYNYDRDEEEEEFDHNDVKEEEEEEVVNEDEGIDLKAEEFIAKFYQQMKLQRQISYLHNSDMINTGSI